LTPRRTASERLEQKLRLILPAIGLPGHRLLEHPRARELYPRYLTVGYHLSHGMMHLLGAALAQARALAPADPVAFGLLAYLERHLAEESHGEQPGGAVLDDLAALGLDPAAVVDEPPSPTIASLVGSQYYWILHHHPVAILGFLQLEAYHPHRPTIELLIERTGFPREGFAQLLLHAELDVAHARELRRVLDFLPLQPRHEQLVGISALQALGLLTTALLDIVGDPAPQGGRLSQIGAGLVATTQRPRSGA
jgi:Iron-containing redox enzyme